MAENHAGDVDRAMAAFAASPMPYSNFRAVPMALVDTVGTSGYETGHESRAKTAGAFPLLTAALPGSISPRCRFRQVARVHRRTGHARQVGPSRRPERRGHSTGKRNNRQESCRRATGPCKNRICQRYLACHPNPPRRARLRLSHAVQTIARHRLQPCLMHCRPRAQLMRGGPNPVGAAGRLQPSLSHDPAIQCLQRGQSGFNQ